MGLLLALGLPPLPGREELRLVHADGEELTLGWVRAEGHRLGKCLSIPRALLDDIEREPAVWHGLREQVRWWTSSARCWWPERASRKRPLLWRTTA